MYMHRKSFSTGCLYYHYYYQVSSLCDGYDGSILSGSLDNTVRIQAPQ
jgi:hypothetical protein